MGINLDVLGFLPYVGIVFATFPLVTLGYFLPHIFWIQVVLVLGSLVMFILLALAFWFTFSNNR